MNKASGVSDIIEKITFNTIIISIEKIVMNSVLLRRAEYKTQAIFVHKL